MALDGGQHDLHPPAALPREESLPVLVLNQRLGGLNIQSGRFAEEKKKSLAPTGRTARSTVATPTELHRPQDTVCSVTHTDSPTFLVFTFRIFEDSSRFYVHFSLPTRTVCAGIAQSV